MKGLFSEVLEVFVRKVEKLQLDIWSGVLMPTLDKVNDGCIEDGCGLMLSEKVREGHSEGLDIA